MLLLLTSGVKKKNNQPNPNLPGARASQPTLLCHRRCALPLPLCTSYEEQEHSKVEITSPAINLPETRQAKHPVTNPRHPGTVQLLFAVSHKCLLFQSSHRDNSLVLRKMFFMMRVAKHWPTLPRKLVDALFLEPFRSGWPLGL